MSIDDTQAAAAASGPVLDFTLRHANDPEFGDLRVVTRNTFEVELRVTTAESKLPAELESALGRKIRVSVGGRSNAAIQADYETTVALLNKAQDNPALKGVNFSVTRDFDLGAAVVDIGAERVATMEDLVPKEVVVRGANAKIEFQETSRSGMPMQMIFGGEHHCTMFSAQYENCNTHDRQVHITADPWVTFGFYGYDGQWTNIRNVAGGIYNGQWVYRVSPGFSDELSTVSYYTTYYFTVEDSGDINDCLGWRQLEGLPLSASRIEGNYAEPGDSGGGNFLYYNDRWYAAGTTSLVWGRGTPSAHTVMAWRNIPSGWTVCSILYPCS